MEKGIITIAVGKKYTTQAKYLALSAMIHSPHVLRAVVTDHPSLLANYYDYILPYDQGYGDPFATKTRINLYTPFSKTLYLDADCLIINNIDVCWKALECRSFAYAGTVAASGEWYFDIAEVIKKFDLPWIARFNSGMFIFDKSIKANSIFDTAFNYLINQKENNLDIDFFREKMLPDEPFFAISLAKHNEKPYDDNYRFSRGIAGATHIHIDVIKGIAYFRSANGNYVHPLVVHFFGRFGNSFYKREKRRIFLYFNPPFSTLFSLLRELAAKFYLFFSRD